MEERELKQMNKSFKLLHKRFEKIIDKPETRRLQERVINIRTNAIENNEELQEQVRKTFKRNDIELFEAKDGDEAIKIMVDLINEYDKENKLVIKSKSNTMGEISARKRLEENGVKVIETDLGDRILQLKHTDNRPVHNTGPASHLSIDEITEIVNDGLNTDLDPVHQDILKTVRADVLSYVGDAKVGITGANAIAAYDGSIAIVHNENNVAYASSRKLHIVLAGIDKLVPEVEDAVSVCKLESVFGTGSPISSYINIISGPSKTADIEKKLLKPMYGAEKVVVILLDNGRSKAKDECLWCINCGNCVVACPVYNVVGNEFGFNYYLGGHGIALSRYLNESEEKDDKKLYMCTLCGMCTYNCPVATPTNELIESLRSKTEYKVDSHRRIKNNIKSNGSPYKHKNH
ncbi:LUD domain-containing protein [Methanobrevibacter sp. AbM4]|uniref:LUD domain-containing protein n=1 Tax=Methanobrevibacter sp. AbM4 TaxID=224719 RepID=UPI00033488C9|nr:LUD domain-containing protein [Methanobrevibacter sp. AbM4]AGN16650.1 iron-sulfur cluster-binding protein [Methanobrevibacter sp. AbM4]